MMNIQDYLNMKKAQGVEENSIRTYLNVLTHLNSFKDLESITKEDLIQYFNSNDFKNKADSTKNLQFMTIKGFFKDNKKVEIVNWIRYKKVKETLSPEQTLNSDDINKLLEVCDNHYDKALIAFLYDSGCRISEAERIKWKNLDDTTDGIIVHIPTKKTHAGFRKVILPFASSYLRNLQIYSYGKPDDFIFNLSYRSHADRIKKIREKSKINKPFTCHKLRHSQATQLVKDGVQEAIIRKKLGWSATSTMIARYQHHSDDDVVNATKKQHGIIEDVHKPAKIDQPEKLSITSATGQLFELQENNDALNNELENLKTDVNNQAMLNEKLLKEMESMKKFMQKLIANIPEDKIEEFAKKF